MLRGHETKVAVVAIEETALLVGESNFNGDFGGYSSVTYKAFVATWAGKAKTFDRRLKSRCNDFLGFIIDYNLILNVLINAQRFWRN